MHICSEFKRLLGAFSEIYNSWASCTHRLKMSAPLRTFHIKVSLASRYLRQRSDVNSLPVDDELSQCAVCRTFTSSTHHHHLRTSRGKYLEFIAMIRHKCEFSDAKNFPHIFPLSRQPNSNDARPHPVYPKWNGSPHEVYFIKWKLPAATRTNFG